MDSFGRIAELIITVLLLFFVPLEYMAVKQDAISQTYVTAETSYFVDSVRNLGYVNREMYETFIRKLDCTNNVYDIEMTHHRYKLEPNEDSYRGHYYSNDKGEILNTIYAETEKTQYLFHQGDYFLLKVKNKNKTFGNAVQELFLEFELPLEQIYVVYGGAIRDEIY